MPKNAKYLSEANRNRCDKDEFIARYVHGPQIDEIVKRTTDNDAVYYHQDALGSTVALTDSNRTVVERYSYDIYGAPTFMDGDGNVVSRSASGNRFLFTGREYLAELSLYDYRNRFYSPDFGRFLQTDPLRFDAGDVNLYRYVENNPINLRDPTGETGFWDWLLSIIDSLLHGITGAGRAAPELAAVGIERTAEEEFGTCVENPPVNDPQCENATDKLDKAKDACRHSTGQE